MGSNAASSSATRGSRPVWSALRLGDLADAAADAALAQTASSLQGLSEAEAARRLAVAGPNVLRRLSATPYAVLARQFRNPLLILLGVAAIASIALGEHSDALIILGIIALSVGLGFFNEYRSERALEDLFARIRHRAVVTREGKVVSVDVTSLVPGDVVLLAAGDLVPADLRLLETNALECDEALLTGESEPVEKTTAPQAQPRAGSSPTCAYMGTVVRNGTARGVAVATGVATSFGKIAAHLAERPPVTAFTHGLATFSQLLVRITAVFSTIVFAVNILLGRGLFESLLFALAIAIAITPQLLPAIVTVSLSVGAKRMAQQSVMVKRLLSIEDLGNIEVLYTDKTGTLTEGEIRFSGAFDTKGLLSNDVMRLGLLCNSALVNDGGVIGGGALDAALWADPLSRSVGRGGYRVIETSPFDYERRSMSALVEDERGIRTLIIKGAPEAVLGRCAAVPAQVHDQLNRRFDLGERLVAVATSDAAGLDRLSPSVEHDLTVRGWLSFSDPPKKSAAQSLARLRELGIQVKVATGDNERVALKVWSELGMATGKVLLGSQIDALDDGALRAQLAETAIFARVTPEQKSRIIRLQRSLGVDVGFLGDGINDAVALHDADVGISVDSGADVAKDAADIVLLDKDLGILADGVAQGRKIFANTIKYVLMGTSSNFGNMISTGTASLFLPFLPMLPSQILLNNLLYDVSEMTIPTDNVDAELLQRPAHWDMRLIQRFLLLFGPINALFDFCIFAVMLFVLHASPTLFRSGFFVESFLTQTLVIFAIRTRRVPFFRSRPSAPLAITTLVAAVGGVAIPFSPLAPAFGFTPLPGLFFTVLMAAIVIAYFALVEVAKVYFYRTVTLPPKPRLPGSPRAGRIHRIISHFRHKPATASP
jgi:Mg2+-importing ATPase